ncbi:hypothetical protein EDD86DRAFT_13118 [Gorgonomyces haynaldii]|nr:hypothetical protein EDD86DRAFT_13118 [Gorgonomyces haynaldii]
MSDKKKYKPNPLAVKYGHHVHKKETKSKADLKKQLRNTQRLMQKMTSAVQQQELKRKVAAIELEIKELDSTQKQDKLREKYKYVRFVESKKLNRMITQTEKAIASEETEELLQKLQDLRLKLLYVERYPTDMKYVSLFPKDSEPHPFGQRIMERIKALKEEGKFEDPEFQWQFKEKTIEKEDKATHEADEFFLE